jgi:hypothetical protein
MLCKKVTFLQLTSSFRNIAETAVSGVSVLTGFAVSGISSIIESTYVVEHMTIAPFTMYATAPSGTIREKASSENREPARSPPAITAAGMLHIATLHAQVKVRANILNETAHIICFDNYWYCNSSQSIPTFAVQRI